MPYHGDSFSDTLRNTLFCQTIDVHNDRGGGLVLFTATITTVVWNSFLKIIRKCALSLLSILRLIRSGGYQVIQSKVAVGSGTCLEKGFLKGTQSKLSYLPEQHTDFIFSVLGEQFGIVGCTIVILLFLLLIVRGLILTQSSRNRFFNLVMVGSVSIIGFHVFVNTAMTIGMMPVTGIPLSFLSYGGSFVLTMAIIVGLMLNTRASTMILTGKFVRYIYSLRHAGRQNKR